MTAAVLLLDEKNSMLLMELGVRCECMVYLTLIVKSMIVKQYDQIAGDLDWQTRIAVL